MAEFDEEHRLELINNKLRELKIIMKPKEKEDLARFCYAAIVDYFKNVEDIKKYINEHKIYLSDDDIIKLAKTSLNNIKEYFKKIEKIKNFIKENNIYLSNDDVLKLAKNSWGSIEAFFFKNKTAGPLVEEEIDEVYHYSQEYFDNMYPQGKSLLDGTPIESEIPEGYREDYFLGPKGPLEEEDSYNKGRRR